MLATALKELQRAEESLLQLSNANDLETADACWVNIVRYLERAWNKTLAEMKSQSKWQGWSERGRIEELRRDDPLLSYLVKARGADEHGIDGITRKQLGSVGIGPAQGNSLCIEKMTMMAGRITELRSPQVVKITVVPAKLSLVPIKNRGRIYPVPTSHLGKSLSNDSVVEIASAAVGFYKATLSCIQSTFGS